MHHYNERGMHKEMAEAYEKARGSIINGAMRINAGAKLNAASVKDQLDWFKAEKLVKDSITYETLVDPSYVETY